MSENQITIVITSYKSQEKIQTALKSINKKYQVIVIENSNNIYFKEEIEKNFSNVKCFLAGENLGYAKGNNLGLSKVKTPYALIINPDVILAEDTIDNFFLRVNEIQTFSIIAPGIQDEIDLSKNVNQFTEVNYVKGFAMFLNINEFKNIGFFDENFFIYLEEIDLCKRLRFNDKKIYLDPKIVVNHQGGSSHDEKYNFEMELSRNWHWMWSSFYYLRKHYGYFYALRSVLKKIISSFLKYIYYSIILNKRKKVIYKFRLSGLYNSIIGNTSWYRPFNNK